MNDIEMRRWNNGDGPILEWTLDGDIRYTNGSHAMLRTWTLDVEGDTIDLSGFNYEYASETLAPILERRGLDVELPKQKQERSLFERIKARIMR